METFLIFIFLFIFFVIFTKSFFKKTVDFIISLSTSDGIQYFLYVICMIECIILSFQRVNFPYVCEYPMIFRCILFIPAIGLVTLLPVLDIMKNPEHEFRKQMIEVQKAKEMLKQSKILLNETLNWKIKYMEILSKCDNEIEKIKNSDLSDEEKKIKEDEIIEKYNKEIKAISKQA